MRIWDHVNIILFDVYFFSLHCIYLKKDFGYVCCLVFFPLYSLFRWVFEFLYGSRFITKMKHIFLVSIIFCAVKHWSLYESFGCFEQSMWFCERNFLLRLFNVSDFSYSTFCLFEFQQQHEHKLITIWKSNKLHSATKFFHFNLILNVMKSMWFLIDFFIKFEYIIQYQTMKEFIGFFFLFSHHKFNKLYGYGYYYNVFGEKIHCGYTLQKIFTFTNLPIFQLYVIFYLFFCILFWYNEICCRIKSNKKHVITYWHLFMLKMCINNVLWPVNAICLLGTQMHFMVKIITTSKMCAIIIYMDISVIFFYRIFFFCSHTRQI